MSYRDENDSSSSDDEDDDEMETDTQIPPLYGPPSGTGGQQVGQPESTEMSEMSEVLSLLESLESESPSSETSSSSSAGQSTQSTSDPKRSSQFDLPDPKRRPPPPPPPSPPQSTITRPADQQNLKLDYARPSDQLPKIVQKYRNPFTGEPDLNAMQKDIDNERGQLVGRSRPLHEMLSLKHKRGAQDIYQVNDGKTFRQKQQIIKKGYKLDPISQRYIKEDSTASGSQMTTTPTATMGWQTPRLERSQSMPDLSALGEVSGKISQMGGRRRSMIMPTGRLGYGMRWSPDLSRTFSANDSSLTTGKFYGEDKSSYTPKERAFSLRLKERPDDELQLYSQYRNMADPMQKDQAVARKRMHRTSSQFGRHKADSSRVKEIREFQNQMLWTEKTPSNAKGIKNMRQYRRSMTKSKRSLPSTRPADAKGLDPILELPLERLGSSTESKKQLESYDRRFQHELRKLKERSIPSMFGQIREEEEEEEQQQMEMGTEEKSDYEQWLRDYQQKHQQPEGGPRDKSPEPPPNPDSCPTQ